MNDRQRIFVAEYCRCLNATKAAVAAGYSEKSARQIAARNMTHPDIRAAIDQGLGARKISGEEVIARLEEHARGSMGDFITVKEREVQKGQGDAVSKQTIKALELDLEKAAARDVLHLIRELKVDPNTGAYTIKLYDAQRALEQLRRHYDSLRKEKLDQGNEPEVTDEELVAMIDELVRSSGA